MKRRELIDARLITAGALLCATGIALAALAVIRELTTQEKP